MAQKDSISCRVIKKKSTAKEYLIQNSLPLVEGNFDIPMYFS
jgi:hypothetical protein